LVTVAVKVTFDPGKDGFGEEVKAPVVVAIVMVCETGLAELSLGLLLSSPL
jgi:hypothetical protein